VTEATPPPAPAGPDWKARAVTLLRFLLPVGLGLVLAVITFNYVVMPRVVRQGRSVEVPNLRGMTLEDAASQVQQAGLAVRDTVERTSVSVPSGLILDQEPSAGRLVKPERRLRLVVSSGGKERRVPPLSNQSLRYARLTLGNEGYELGDVIRVPDPDVAPNVVLATDPPESTVLGPGQAVHLLVSTGAESGSWVLPDLRGMRLGTVEEDLRLAGFLVETRRESFGWFRGGLRVVETEPRPGARVRPGDRIVLVGG
jgi:serine/threonine-protein kinase